MLALFYIFCFLAPLDLIGVQSVPAMAGMSAAASTNILLVGTDMPSEDSKAGEFGFRTDTLILASCDPIRFRVTMLSIPRDTLVQLPGHGLERINMASMYGGIAMTVQAVEELTHIHVDRYVSVDFQAFAELIDLLGGVEVDVDKRMYYEDKSQGLLIDLQKGRQLLNGEQALGFVRYRRDPLGDITRVSRQQRLLRAVLDKVRQEQLWTKIFALYSIKQRYVRTDLGLLDVFRLRAFAACLTRPEGEDLVTFTVPGDFSGPYWAPDTEALADLIAREFEPPGSENSPRELPWAKYEVLP